MPPKGIEPLKTASVSILRPGASLLGLNQRISFLSILRSLGFTVSVSKEFLESHSAALINPRHHRIATDQVSLRLPAVSFAGLDDEAVLALFTRGFFGGWIFAIERWIMKVGGWRLLPVGFTGFKRSEAERTIWKCSKIPKLTRLPKGDVLFGSFKLVDSHISTPSDPHPSYVDFGFGSDQARFAGCHRFSIVRNQQSSHDLPNDEVEEIEMRLEHFHCNPRNNVDSVEYIAWFHYWYAKLLFADGIRACVRGS